MDCIVNEPDPVLKPFFDNFSDLWSRPNQAQAFGAYVRGLLSETHRKNIEAMNTKIVAQEYQGLHHFLNESPWDAQELNDRRIALLEGNRRTASCHRRREAAIHRPARQDRQRPGVCHESLRRRAVSLAGGYCALCAGCLAGGRQAGPRIPHEDRTGPSVGGPGRGEGLAFSCRGGRRLVWPLENLRERA